MKLPDRIEITIETPMAEQVRVRFCDLYKRWHTYKVLRFKESGRVFEIELVRE